jgi:hypothetical protein
MVTLSFVITGWLGKVDPRGGTRGDLLHPVHVGLEVADVDGAGSFNERDQNVEARAGEPVELSQPLDDEHFGLSDDLEGLCPNEQDQKCQNAESDEHAYIA